MAAVTQIFRKAYLVVVVGLALWSRDHRCNDVTRQCQEVTPPVVMATLVMAE